MDFPTDPAAVSAATVAFMTQPQVCVPWGFPALGLTLAWLLSPGLRLAGQGRDDRMCCMPCACSRDRGETGSLKQDRDRMDWMPSGGYSDNWEVKAGRGGPAGRRNLPGGETWSRKMH